MSKSFRYVVKSKAHLLSILHLAISALCLTLSKTLELQQLALAYKLSLLLRLFHPIKILLSTKSFKQLSKVSKNSLKPFTSLVFLIYLIITIFALLGKELFPFIFWQDGVANGINRHANFTSFRNGFMSLVRISVSENWPDLLQSLIRGSDPEYPCINFNGDFQEYQKYGNQISFIFLGMSQCSQYPILGFIFVTSFYYMITFIFMNLLIAVILESFDLVSNQSSSFVGNKDIGVFQELWSRYDKTGKGMIKVDRIVEFFGCLEGNFGLDPGCFSSEKSLFDYVSRLILPVYYKSRQDSALNEEEDEDTIENREYFFHYFDALLAISRDTMVRVGGKKYKE